MYRSDQDHGRALLSFRNIAKHLPFCMPSNQRQRPVSSASCCKDGLALFWVGHRSRDIFMFSSYPGKRCAHFRAGFGNAFRFVDHSDSQTKHRSTYGDDVARNAWMAYVCREIRASDSASGLTKLAQKQPTKGRRMRGGLKESTWNSPASRRRQIPTAIFLLPWMPAVRSLLEKVKEPFREIFFGN